MCWHFDDVVQEQVQSRITQAYNVGSKVIWRMEPVNINSELLHKLWQKNLGQLLLLCVIHIWPWPKGYTLRLFYCSCFTFSICYCSIFSVDDALSKMSVKVDWNPLGYFFQTCHIHTWRQLFPKKSISVQKKWSHLKQIRHDLFQRILSVGPFHLGMIEWSRIEIRVSLFLRFSVNILFEYISFSSRLVSLYVTFG